MRVFTCTLAALAVATALAACAPLLGTAPHRSTGPGPAAPTAAAAAGPPGVVGASGAPVPSASAPSRAPAADSGERYRCSDGSAFSVLQLGDGAARLAGLPGMADESLLRDAGGQTPQQTVYRSDRVRAQFGLGAGGAGARIEIAAPARTLDCTRG